MKSDENKKYKIFSIVNICLAILIALIITLGIKSEYLTMKELGKTYEKIFYINLQEKTYIMATVFSLTFIIISLINKSLKKEFKILFEKENKSMPKYPNFSLAFLISIINAGIAQIVFRGKILDLLNVGWFGKTLDNLKLDYNFAIIIGPIIQKMLVYLGTMLVISLLYAFIYFLSVINFKLGGIDSSDLKNSTFVNIFRKTGIRILLIALIIYVIGTLNIFSGDMFKKKFPESIYLTGAGLADVKIKIWGRLCLSIIYLFIIMKINRNIKNGKGIKAIRNLIAIPVLTVILYLIIFAFNLIYVRPNKLEKENKYIVKNIKATEEAFGINLKTKIIDKTTEITREELPEIKNTLDMVPLVSETIAEDNLESFKKKDLPYKYMKPSIINTDNSIKYFSPREIKETKKRTIDDKTYVYNHGIAGAVTDALKVDKEGFLILDNKNFENFNIKNKEIKEPRIYYGLNTHKNTIVGPNITEFDYEKTNKETKEKEIVTNKYNGKGGLKLSKKESLLLSFSKLDFNIFKEGKNKENRVLFNRQIIDRAKTVLPQLTYDEKPYILPNEKGGFTWVLDAYTTTNKYPYSQKILIKNDNGNLRRINYFKNSIKVLIDAYDGTMEFYITDESDPYAKQIQNKYKKLFKTTKDMPKIIKDNLIYPRRLYAIQAKVIENYHGISADTLYRSEDIWEASSIKNGNNKKIEARYINMKENFDDPNSQNKLSILTMYTSLNKQNINAYLIGNVKEGDNKLTLVKFDQNEGLLSLNYMKDKIHEDEKAKLELDKLNRIGTEIVKDTMLIPLKSSILYVEPVYQIHLNENSIPVLKMVVVANGTKVGIGSNMTEAVTNLLSDTAININIYNPDDFKYLLETIILSNKNLKESLNTKNWDYIGKDINKITKLIDELERIKNKEEILKEKEKINNKQKENNEVENNKEDTEKENIFKKVFKKEK